MFNSNGTPERDDDTFNKSSWWFGELYNIRKDYRPFRTIKLRMDYSRRSEMLLQAGVSTDVNATEPESVTDMHHFRYAGDGKNGSSNPAPSVPMLGRWADGKLHNEPMEFGYDLTDLSAGYDRNQPLKYFFIVNTRDWAVGKGSIYYASIIDYEYDLEGIETPFDLGETGQVEIKNAGEKTIISVVVQGAAYNAPVGLTISDGKLVWNRPVASGREIKGYHIYKDGELVGWTDAATLQWPVDGSGTYSVEATYADGVNSQKVSVTSAAEKADENVVINLNNSGFSIPDVFTKKYQNCTIEFYIKPNSLINWNNMFGPGWGTFLFHCNANGAVSAGWRDNERINTSAGTLNVGNWAHLTLVVQGNKMTLYKRSSKIGDYTSSGFSGIGGFGNLVFRSSGNEANDCSYDEIRIWDRALSSTEVGKRATNEFYGDEMPEGLVAYFKGDTFEKDGCTYLRDCVGGHHALMTNNNFKSEVPASQPSLRDPISSISAKINPPSESAIAGMPVTLTADRNESVRSLKWSVPALGITDLSATELTVIFPKTGTYEVTMKGYGYEKNGTVPEVSDMMTITVGGAAAPVADFEASLTEVPAGERVSFIASNPLSGYIYEWSVPGSENEEMFSPKVATSFVEAGTYTVTLTVTSPSGEKTQSSKQIVVTRVKPEADFAITKPVIMKGESTVLVNKSKHDAAEIQWTIESPKQKIVVNGGQNYTLNPTEPGIYSVTLKASNDLGDDEKTQEHAIVVTNANSKNGLSFNSANARVELEKPVSDDETVNTLTISWWMNPTKLQEYCLGMGESKSTFMLRTDPKGNVQVWAGDGVADSQDIESGFIIAGEWHHYAVIFTSVGKVRFVRDGEEIGKGGVAVKKGSTTIKSFTCPATFGIGLADAPMNGMIDEFAIWGKALTPAEVKELCNEPIADPELYITGEKAAMNLRAYYQFNQSGGDVQDLTSYQNTGKRINFGPEGDAWGLSQGVFCLNFGDKQDDLVLDGISNIKGLITKGDAIFNLKGQRVDEKNLTPGIYIQQGRKIIVK